MGNGSGDVKGNYDQNNYIRILILEEYCLKAAGGKRCSKGASLRIQEDLCYRKRSIFLFIYSVEFGSLFSLQQIPL